MPELLDAPPTQDAKSMFHGVESFENPNPQPVQQPKTDAAPTQEQTKPEATPDASKPDAVTDKPKSRLEKMGEVKKPEPPKEEAKVEGQPKADAPKEPNGNKELRQVYNITKAEAETLRKELDKIKPDYEQIKKDFDLTREELTKLKAMNLSDEERTRFDSLREMHALAELRESKDYQEKILAPIHARIAQIDKVATEAKLDPVATEAMKNAMDLPDELDRNREIRRILKSVPDLEPDDFADYYQSMTGVGKALNETLYPKLEAAERQAAEIEQASRTKQKEQTEQAKNKEKEEYQREHEFVQKTLTEGSLKTLIEDTGLSVDGTTLAEALKSATPAENPRERALEVQAAAAMPFLVSFINKLWAEKYSLEQANKARNGASPKLSDGQPKPQQTNGHNPDAKAVFQGQGSFGG